MYRRNSQIVGNSAKMLKSTRKRTKLIIYVKKIIFGFLTLNVWEKLEKCRKPAHKCSKALENELNLIIYVKKIIFGFLTLNVWEKFENYLKQRKNAQKHLKMNQINYIRKKN